jgi:tetratricopeptide (TPR) repeat protein
MRTFVAVFAVVAMLSAPVRLTAQDVDEVGALTRRVDQLLQVDRYSDALSIAQRALAMLKARYSEDDFHNATLLKRVAEMYARQGRYGDAEPFERRSLAVDEHMFGADNFLISNSLLRLADTHRILNEADAEALYNVLW